MEKLTQTVEQVKKGFDNNEHTEPLLRLSGHRGHPKITNPKNHQSGKIIT